MQSPKQFALAILFGYYIALFYLFGVWMVSLSQPEAYMDEPFHEKQTIAYCDGKWSEWDPKITTFPGLYLFFKLLTLMGVSCQLQNMRFLNIFFSCGILVLTAIICSRLNPQYRSDQIIMKSLIGFSFPFLFSSYFLYYTDAGSLFFVLATYLAALNKRYFLSSMLGFAAIMFRQNNIVWCFYIVMHSIIDDFYRERTTEELQQWNLSALLLAFVRHIFSHLGSILLNFSGFLGLAFMFAAFLYRNKSAVLGDASAHEFSLHFAQMNYFVVVLAMTNAFQLLQQDNRKFFGLYLQRRFFSKWNLALMILFALVLFIVVRDYTIAHLYLLSDNRHLTFYLWRKIIDPFRYHLIPLYLASYLYCWFLLNKGFKLEVLQVWCYAFVCGLVLVPTPLLEVRYFIVPLYLSLLQLDYKGICGYYTLIAFCFVNLITTYLFLALPFLSNDGSVSRFMW